MPTLLDRLRREREASGWRRAPRFWKRWPVFPALHSRFMGRGERLTDTQVYGEPWI